MGPDMAAELVQFESDLETRYTTRRRHQQDEQTVNRDQASPTEPQTDYDMILEVQLDDNAIVTDILIKQSLAPAHTVGPGQ